MIVFGHPSVLLICVVLQILGPYPEIGGILAKGVGVFNLAWAAIYSIMFWERNDDAVYSRWIKKKRGMPPKKRKYEVICDTLLVSFRCSDFRGDQRRAVSLASAQVGSVRDHEECLTFAKNPRKFSRRFLKFGGGLGEEIFRKGVLRDERPQTSKQRKSKNVSDSCILPKMGKSRCKPALFHSFISTNHCPSVVTAKPPRFPGKRASAKL